MISNTYISPKEQQAMAITEIARLLSQLTKQEEQQREIDALRRVAAELDNRIAVLESRSSEAAAKVWLTTQEAADYIGVSHGVMYLLARDNKVPYTMQGKRKRFSRTDLDAVLNDRRVETTAKRAAIYCATHKLPAV